MENRVLHMLTKVSMECFADIAAKMQNGNVDFCEDTCLYESEFCDKS